MNHFTEPSSRPCKVDGRPVKGEALVGRREREIARSENHSGGGGKRARGQLAEGVKGRDPDTCSSLNPRLLERVTAGRLRGEALYCSGLRAPHQRC